MPVTLIIGSLAGGMTFEEIEREYDLTAEDIRAALKFVREPAFLDALSGRVAIVEIDRVRFRPPLGH